MVLDNIKCSELGLNGFVVLRCERSTQTSIKFLGGSVLFAIKSHLELEQIALSNDSF